MPIDRHSGARTTFASPEPKNTAVTCIGKSRCSWLPDLPFGHPGMTILGFIGLLLTLLATGCADSRAASDNDKRPVFYGGVSSGGSPP